MLELAYYHLMELDVERWLGGHERGPRGQCAAQGHAGDSELQITRTIGLFALAAKGRAQA
jgi:hypothetical protein